jgi:hypothetical protein
VKSNKKLRRFLKRLAARRGISYAEAIQRHLGGEVDKNIKYSLYKRRNKGRKRKQEKEQEAKEKEFKLKFGI